LITGTLFEKKIVEYLQIFFNCSFKTYDAKTIFNFFDENKIFDGVPDCEPINDKNKFLYKDGFPLIEIKTISLDKLCYNEDEFGNKKMFRNLNNEPLIKIPKFNAKSFVRENAKKTLDEKIRKYALQLSFYMYLRKIDLGIETINGAIAIAFIEKDEYIFDENDIECINKINLFTKRINENKKINFDSSKNSNHNYVNKIELIYAKLDEKNILSYSFCGKEFEINIEEKIEKCRE
jgi:hypothetical protein